MSVSLQNISMNFPGTLALSDVSLTFDYDAVHGLIGENGAGKSTFVNILAGSLTPSAGEMTKNGKTVLFESPAAALSVGIAHVSQEGSLVPQFTGAENIMLGAEPKTKLWTIDKTTLRSDAQHLVAKWFPQLDLDLSTSVDQLSIAERKVIEIVRALRGNIDLLILDEPTATLEDREKKQLWEIIRRLPRCGVGVVLISHFLSEIVQLSDKISVLRDGRHVKTLDAEGTTESQLTELMLARANTLDEKNTNQAAVNRIDYDRSAIAVADWTVGAVSLPELRAHPGEILGLIGLTGAGHFGFARSLYTRAGVTSGKLFLDGEEFTARSIRAIQQAGVAFIPDDRMENSLNGAGTVNENLAIVHSQFAATGGIIALRKDHNEADAVIKNLNIKTPNRRQLIRNLSGGNKQKVSIGKWAYGARDRYKVLIFIEPTEGVDIGAKQEIYANLYALAQRGALIIIASSDLGEIARVCDRVIPFNHGQTGDEILAADFSEAAFIKAISRGKE